MGKGFTRRSRQSLLVAIAIGFTLITTAIGGESLTLQGSRWLVVDQRSGSVMFTPYQQAGRQVQLGDRLTGVGDMLTTGANASARLEVDQQTGFVTLAENSQVQVRSLGITRSGGRITHLSVTRGQVRLRVRPLTNPDTQLELHTPAGVSGVRGTDFGITVQNNGQTGVATIEGSVHTSAQGETVVVGANLQSTIIPGEPPTAPEPLRNDPTLFIEQLSPIPNSTLARVVGKTDTVNLLEIANQQKQLNREGHFDVVVSISDNRRISARVITPLGTEQAYELMVP